MKTHSNNLLNIVVERCELIKGANNEQIVLKEVELTKRLAIIQKYLLAAQLLALPNIPVQDD